MIFSFSPKGLEQFPPFRIPLGEVDAEVARGILAEPAHRHYPVPYELLLLERRMGFLMREVGTYPLEELNPFAGKFQFDRSQRGWVVVQDLANNIQPYLQENKDPRFQGLSENIEDLLALDSLYMERLSKFQFFPEGFRQHTHRRLAQSEDALHFLQGRDDVSIAVMAGISGGGGVFGTMALLAGDLAEALPEAKIKLVTWGENDHFRVIASDLALPRNVEIVEEDRLDSHEPYRDCQFIVAHDCKLPDGIPDSALSTKIDCYSMARSSDAPRAHDLQVTNNLTYTLGSLVLRRGLAERREKRDLLSKDELKAQREKWLERWCSRDLLESLTNAGKAGGWDPNGAVWSWAYVQDSINFHEEMQKLADFLKTPEKLFRQLPETEKQIVLHLTYGHWEDNHTFLQKFKEMGFGVIDSEDGYTRGTLPVTVVNHRLLPNKAVQSLLSEQCGTLDKGRNGIFIGFPQYVTGNGSFFEAVSVGDIVRHDQRDIGAFSISPTLIPMLARYVALQDDLGRKSHAEVKEEARSLFDVFIAGGGDFNRLYSDLAGWTYRAREFSQACFTYNMSHDILSAVAWEIRGRPLFSF